MFRACVRGASAARRVYAAGGPAIPTVAWNRQAVFVRSMAVRLSASELLSHYYPNPSFSFRYKASCAFIHQSCPDIIFVFFAGSAVNHWCADGALLHSRTVSLCCTASATQPGVPFLYLFLLPCSCSVPFPSLPFKNTIMHPRPHSHKHARTHAHTRAHTIAAGLPTSAD